MAYARCSAWFSSCWACLVLSRPAASAEEYRLQVANLYRDSFAHFIDGPIRTGSGELAMPNLERALDSGDISPGALAHRSCLSLWLG